jgi:cell division protein FtsB
MRFPQRSGRSWSHIAAGVLIVSLIGAMAIEPTRQLLAQKQRITGLDQQLAATKSDNRRLAERIQRLNDSDFIEQRARAQLGLILPGETAFVVMPPSEAKRQKKVEVQEEPAPVSEPGFFEGLLDFVGLAWL